MHPRLRGDPRQARSQQLAGEANDQLHIPRLIEQLERFGIRDNDLAVVGFPQLAGESVSDLYVAVALKQREIIHAE
ncbi:hypothetical protein D3C78_1581960 [compost metagenome]